MLEVQSDGPLAGIDGKEQRGHAGLDEARVGGGAEAAALVAAGAVLDLDHIGAEQRELLCAVRTGEHLGEIDNAHPLERQPRHLALRLRGAVLPLGHPVPPFAAGIRYIYPFHPRERRPGP